MEYTEEKLRMGSLMDGVYLSGRMRDLKLNGRMEE